MPPANYFDEAKKLGSRLGLERIAMLCESLGHPQDSHPTVHVAGTNGKGSTAAMIASALTAAGYRTGLYTSPYLLDISECLQIDGTPISSDELGAVSSVVAEKAAAMATDGAEPTSFELETAMAFLWFRLRQCDITVIETGLGGRRDATNVIKSPAVTVITSISYDHVNILGNTLSQIAAEKCGIIKPGGITVCYPCQADEVMAVIREQAEVAGNRLLHPDPASVCVMRSGLAGSVVRVGGLTLRVPLIGRHQAWNAATAVVALRALGAQCGLPVSDDDIALGISRVSLPMRQELAGKDPDVLIDGAHNLDKLTALAQTMGEHLGGRNTVVVMGMLKDKDYEPSIVLIAGRCHHFIACAPSSDRALPSETTAAIARGHCEDVRIIDDVALAIPEALKLAGREGAVVVCGSFYLAGPARSAFFKITKNMFRQG